MLCVASGRLLPELAPELTFQGHGTLSPSAPSWAEAPNLPPPARPWTERRAEKVRETQLDFFRQLLGERDLSSELDLVLSLLRFTPFADLIDRRRALLQRGEGHKRARAASG